MSPPIVMAMKRGLVPMPGFAGCREPGDRASRVLQEVEDEAKLDMACKWLEGWSHKSRCQVLEQLLLRMEHPHIQQLWTDLQPILHRDFMYAAGKLYPGFRFTPVSTELSRKIRKHIQAGRVGRNLYRVPSVFLRDVSDVRRHNASRGGPAQAPADLPKGHESLPQLSMLRPVPRLEAKHQGRETDHPSREVRFPALPNAQHAVMSFPAHQPDRVKILAARPRWKLRKGKPEEKRDGTTYLSLEKQGPRDPRESLYKDSRTQDQVSRGGLTAEQKRLIRWYDSQWSYKQRTDFLKKLLLLLDPRQHYYISSFLVVLQYKDFIGDLPRKISLHILGLLSPWDLLRASQVSRTWYQLCSCDDVWKPKCEDPALGVGVTAGSALTDCKKVFKRRYCTSQNWQRGACRSREVTGHTAKVCCLALQDDHLASGSKDHTILVWQLPKGNLLQTLQGHQKGVWGLQFFTNNLLVSASSDSSIKIWNIRLGVCLQTLFGHSGPVWCIALAGDLLVSGSQDTKIKVWDLRHCQPVRTLRGHTQAVLALELDQDNRRVYSGSADKCLRIWDLDSARCLKVMWPTSPDGMPTAAIMSISFAKGYLACCAGAWVWLYHVGTGKCLQVYRQHEKRVDCVKLKMCPQQQTLGYLLSSGQDGIVKYCSLAEPDTSLRILKGHRGRVTCLSFDDSRIFSASQDHCIRVWDFAGEGP